MSRPKAEMSVEQKENGQIVEYVAYPYVEYDHVTMENGMDIMSMIRDDVSTPLVTHDTSSWKAGQGDSDVSDSIVDSSIASMTIKGQTYQNILPSPTLRNSMTDGNTMQKINEGYDSIEVVDGNVKSAILSGQTLVNALQEPQNFRIYGEGTTSYYYRTYKTPTLKANTKYYYKVLNMPTNANWVLADSSSTQNVYFAYGSAKNTSGTITLNDNVVSSTKLWVRFLNGETSTVDVLNKIQIIFLEYQDGMENWDIPYFEGMQSVKLPVLTTSTTLINYDVQFTDTGKDLISDFIKIPENIKGKILYPSFNTNKINENTSKQFGMETYDSNKQLLSRKGYWLNNCYNGLSPIILNEEVNYVKFEAWSCYELLGSNGKIGLTEMKNINYIPYKSNILSCLEPVELGSVGEVKDELNLLTQQLTQRTETRPYQEGDELNSEFVTDMTNTRYKLAQEVVKTVDLSVLDQDNQPVTQLNSFANGHIQVSSQGLIPSIEYEVPTSNSYHVDLAKPSTQYTMKNMTGTFTIDGTQYNASANGTFTTPSTLTNRLMITNVVQTQPMLLEGDMTSKEVPYVEGIKSAFEGADKVEIVSQNADNTLSNTTSFQLSNPLRSLPNSVRDEIVLDRVNHKAKIIQRVGEDLTQLDTPIVTEVNLEGYPYVYKDGHIFLNTEIAPTTEVKYSINQAHQIESSNEDILRHQKEINYLYELIAQYVQVQYEAELIDIALQG